MSLVTNLVDAFTRAASEAKSLRTLLNGNQVDNSALTTTAKSNLVAAINEVAASAGSASGIDDGTSSTSTTWSSSKIGSEIGSASTADRARANHTGTQPHTTITGLAAVASSGTYTDLSDRPTIPASYSDLTGTVPQAALPAVALTDYLGEVGSEAALLALTGQRGDWATRTDLGTDWQLIADNPAVLSSWRQHVYPASPVSSVNGRTGAVTGLSEAADVGNTNTDFVAVFEAALV